jgi:hypothetical protein
MKKKLTALLLCFLCQAAFAQAPDIRAAPDCGSWLKPENATKELINMSWLSGYLSGLNVGFSLDLRRKPFNYFEGVTPGQIYLWMDNYCRANPLSGVIAGSVVLFIEKSNK